MTEGNQDMDLESKWEDLMNNDIRIKVLVEGVGELAEMGTVVRCSYDCYILDNDTKERKGLVESVKDSCFKIGEGDCIPGLELALRHAREGRTMLVQCTSKFAYGFVGRPASGNHMEIPPNADIEFNVTKIDFVDYSDLTPLERAVEDIKLRKDCGNHWFASKDYPRAGRSYSKGIQAAEGALNLVTEDLSSSSEAHALQEAYMFCLNNLAATYICTSEYTKAKEVCIRVLEIQPRNVKAILRAAKASLALDEYEECEACLNRALEIDPSNPDALKERIKLRKAQKLYRESSKRMAKRMSKQLFAPSSETKTDEPPDVTPSQSDNDINLSDTSIQAQSEIVPTDEEEDHINGSASSADEPSNSASGSLSSKDIPRVSSETSTEVKKKTSSTRKNTVLLLTTSLVVVLMSVVVFFVVNQQPS